MEVKWWIRVSQEEGWRREWISCWGGGRSQGGWGGKNRKNGSEDTEEKGWDWTEGKGVCCVSGRCWKDRPGYLRGQLRPLIPARCCFLSLSSWNLFVLGSHWRKKSQKERRIWRKLCCFCWGRLENYKLTLLEQLSPHEHTFDTWVYFSSKPGWRIPFVITTSIFFPFLFLSSFSSFPVFCPRLSTHCQSWTILLCFALYSEESGRSCANGPEAQRAAQGKFCCHWWITAHRTSVFKVFSLKAQRGFSVGHLKSDRLSSFMSLTTVTSEELL